MITFPIDCPLKLDRHVVQRVAFGMMMPLIFAGDGHPPLRGKLDADQELGPPEEVGAHGESECSWKFW